MGDRVVVTFTDDGNSYTPGIYLHWGGEEMPELIRRFQGVMRKGDASYAAARFCGECHKMLISHTGLGLVDAPPPYPSADEWESYSHGDAGVYVVNVSTAEVECYAGYGKGFLLDPDGFANGLI